MIIDSTSVALLHCSKYIRNEIAETVDRLCAALQFRVTAGTRVLLKPNLLSGRSKGHLACTHPEFVAAAAEWFLAQGAVVEIGDSPAFGTARGVMRAIGVEKALAGLPVKRINFDCITPVRLSGGVKVNIASAALECDMLVNLPRVKAHSQFYLTLAVKNYFGTVVGFQKPAWHFRYGDKNGSLASHLVDLLEVLPPGITLIDGIMAMHGTGPVSGRPYSLNLAGGTINPVAADTALLQTLKLNLDKSAVWQECAKRGLVGSKPNLLSYPLAKPEEFNAEGFSPPGILKPETFNPLQIMVSACRRWAAGLKESS